MSVTFSPPTITGSTPEAQLSSMQSWLFQFTEQLQYTLNNLDGSNFSEGGNEELFGKGSSSKTREAVQGEFDALKSLIIKTSNTVKAKYEEITETLESDYLAISDFGEFSENNKLTIVKNALGITQYFDKVEEVSGKMDDAEESIEYIKKTKAYIKTGYLEQLEKYGVAIGEENVEIIDGVEAVTFDLFATLTSEELAFWQNGVKLGWFKGDSLYVNNAMRIGRWAIDTKSGFTIKYV